MKKSIWKFEIPLEEKIALAMPKGTQIIAFQMQGDKACIWGIVEPSRCIETRKFVIRGTGHEFEDDPGTYVGTVQEFEGRFVWHLFEVS